MALSTKAGTYTGNGSDPQTITGIGFQPKVVFVFATTGVGDGTAACFKTADMSTGSSGLTSNMGENGQQTNGLVDSLNSDGFLVRGLKNTNAVTYYYLALAGSDCVTGTYTGNATDNRSITGIGFLPEWVVIQGGTNHSFHKSTATSNDVCQKFTNEADITNAIQLLESDGFQLGSSSTVNQNTTTFYYVAVKGANMSSGTYTGNATDSRNITGVGFTPTSVFVKSVGSVQATARSGESGDLSSLMRGSNPPISNAIQSYVSDGFQIGTESNVNTNLETYYWVAFGNLASGPSNMKSYNGNLTANIKSMSGNLIANVKSFDGNA